jgi:hypothetical protein
VLPGGEHETNVLVVALTAVRMKLPEYAGDAAVAVMFKRPAAVAMYFTWHEPWLSVQVSAVLMTHVQIW